MLQVRPTSLSFGVIKPSISPVFGSFDQDCSSLFRYPEQERIFRRIVERKAQNGQTTQVVNIGLANGEELITQAAIAEPVAKKYKRPLSKVLKVTAIDKKNPSEIKPSLDLGHAKPQIAGISEVHLREIGPVNIADLFQYEFHEFYHVPRILKQVKDVTISSEKQALGNLLRLSHALVAACDKKQAVDKIFDEFQTQLDAIGSNRAFVQKLALAQFHYQSTTQPEVPTKPYVRYFVPPSQNSSNAYSFSPAVKTHVLDTLKQGRLGTSVEDFVKQEHPANADVVRVNNVLQYMGRPDLGNSHIYSNPFRPDAVVGDAKDPKFREFKNNLAGIVKLVKPGGYFMADLDTINNQLGAVKRTRKLNTLAAAMRHVNTMSQSPWPAQLHEMMNEFKNFEVRNEAKGIYQRVR